MQWLARVCVQRPIFASVLMLFIVVLGLAGYAKLGVDEFPNVEVPIVVVTTRLPGAAPEEVETDVTDKIEGALNTIAGLDELRSASNEGVSQVIATFVLDRNIDSCAQDVRDKISTILGELPKGIDPPIVSKVDLGAAPVLTVAIGGNKPIRELTEVADKLVRRRIESMPGVGQVVLVGGRSRQINLWLDTVALRAAKLTANDVQRAVAAQNLTTPGGSVETGPRSLTLRVQGRVDSIDAVKRIVVRESGARPIRVEDVARVEDGQSEEDSYGQFDDDRAVVLRIRKQSGENTVAVVDTVRARLDEVRASLPPGVKLEVVRDNSGTIRTGIAAVKEHLALGALFAALVVLLFLGNVRSTVISGLAIPISIIGTFGVMYVAGFTLNMITLLALTLAVGIVIDDAIVVLENILRFIEEKKVKPFPAAVLATKDIGLAVLATTISLMAVFIPVAFLGGIPGRFLRSFGLTMAAAIFVSLIVSFSLTPALSARWLRPHREGATPGGLERLVDVFYRPIERGYLALLGWVMKRRWVVIVAAVLALFSTGPIAKTIPGGFLPVDDRGQFEVSIRAPEGTSVTETRLIAERVSQEMRRLPGVEHTLLLVGEDDFKTPNLAKVAAYMSDPKTRAETQLQVMDIVRKQIFPKLPKNLRLTVAEVQAVSIGASAANIQYVLAGPDLAVLSEKATKVTDGLRKVKGAVDVDNTLVVGKPELRAIVDRDRAADLGVRVTDIASTLQLLVAGLKTSSYAEGGEQYDVRVRADERFRNDRDALGMVTVPSSKLGSVPLLSVVSFQEKAGPSTINRLARQRQITISANAAPGVGDSTIEASLKQLVADENLPPGYRLVPVGRTKESGRLVGGFLLVIGLSFVFMYLILAAQFESWLHPVTILLSLPLTVPFAMMSLKIFGEGLNLFSGLGILVLFGVVKKNAILQIDHTNHLVAQGKSLTDAILEANKDRLRPILMTTLAFVAGMIPLMTSRGVGSGSNHAIAGIVLGGQSLSLILTLLATPVAYSYFEQLQEWRRRKRKAGAEDRGEAELEAVLRQPETFHQAAAE